LDAKGEIVQSKKVKVWNATVANLTLMALGSSAPEIILSILETCLNLGQCPGELGASTIVGSAAFNLLVISGVSIYAVHKDNDTDPDKAEEDRGVKKINNMYVFGITATFSVWAYVWLFIVLQDQFVTPAEAWITFAFMFILLGLAYFADWYKAKYKDTKEDDTNEAVIEYTAVEIFKEMTNEQMGKPPKDEEETKKREKMKQFM
jgi:solute carrier family 8 (sodium/calcium exchanger)